MTINPYEPPLAPIGPPSPVDAANTGPWRDGNLMVVRVNNSGTLPLRCVLTGVPVEHHQLFLHQLSHYSKAYSFTLARAVEVDLYWPVSDAVRPRVLPRQVMQGIAWVGTGATLLGSGLIPGVPTSIQVGANVVLACVVVLGVLFILINRFAMRRFPSIVQGQNGFAWISGVHRDLLSELPPWPGGSS